MIVLVCMVILQELWLGVVWYRIHRMQDEIDRVQRRMSTTVTMPVGTFLATARRHIRKGEFITVNDIKGGESS